VLLYFYLLSSFVVVFVAVLVDTSTREVGALHLVEVVYLEGVVALVAVVEVGVVNAAVSHSLIPSTTLVSGNLWFPTPPCIPGALSSGRAVSTWRC
jgi:hypothetical protein